MKKILMCLMLMSLLVWADKPVLTNPGIPSYEYYQVKDYINKDVRFVTATITVKRSKDAKVYNVTSVEGPYFLNKLVLDAKYLTPVTEERYDARKNKLLEAISVTPQVLKFYQRAKNINLRVNNPDHNTYSRYTYFMSLRGFPFKTKQEVVFMSYMFEYGNALPIKVTKLGEETVQVPAGKYRCYKLAVEVGGWQGVFAPDKYYLYFTVDNSHHFVKFDQKVEDGKWLSNELISYMSK